MDEFTSLPWFKSSPSGANGCVAIAHAYRPPLSGGTTRIDRHERSRISRRDGAHR